MKIIHEYEPGKFQPWNGEPVSKTCDKATVTTRFEDGREEARDIDVPAYEATIQLPMPIADAWSDDELSAMKLYRVAPFVPPKGKRAIGDPSYQRVKGKVVETYAIEDIPPPPPPPTFEEKLIGMGFSPDEARKMKEAVSK